MRAEVGVLSRNVRIAGVQPDERDAWGGHVHVIGTANVQIDVRRIPPHVSALFVSCGSLIERRVLCHWSAVEQSRRAQPFLRLL